MVATPFPALPQPKALLERFHQVIGGRDRPRPPRPTFSPIGAPGTPWLCLRPQPWFLAAPTPSVCPPATCRPPQVPSGIILQSKAVGTPAAPQTSASLGPLGSPTASGLVSGQAPSGTSTAPSHAPAPAPVATAGRGEVAHARGLGGPEGGWMGGWGPGRTG